jgi:hypothetical protein
MTFGVSSEFLDITGFAASIELSDITRYGVSINYFAVSAIL